MFQENSIKGACRHYEAENKGHWLSPKLFKQIFCRYGYGVSVFIGNNQTLVVAGGAFSRLAISFLINIDNNCGGQLLAIADEILPLNVLLGIASFLAMTL